MVTVENLRFSNTQILCSTELVLKSLLPKTISPVLSRAIYILILVSKMQCTRTTRWRGVNSRTVFKREESVTSLRLIELSEKSEYYLIVRVLSYKGTGLSRRGSGTTRVS